MACFTGQCDERFMADGKPLFMLSLRWKLDIMDDALSALQRGPLNINSTDRRQRLQDKKGLAGRVAGKTFGFFGSKFVELMLMRRRITTRIPDHKEGLLGHAAAPSRFS